ncbi:MAG: sigma-70 family RNA polymerase sigma factor [Planctomycetes bacterium]|nr:sigma-70 family RNA polymerase sigma factor [Planctomycetota bacterium]
MSGSAHDDGWIRSVLDRHEGPLLAYATRLLSGDVERARDLVQDCFLRLVRADRDALGERTTVWLYQVCRNRAFDLRAKEKPMLALDTDEPRHDPSSPGPLEHLEARDDAAQLRSAVERLPERERELVRLKFEHGLSYAEMGAITGLTATNVGFLLHRALGALRERLPVTREPARRECAS